MMISGAVTGRIYEALKRQVLSGALKPGTRLDPARLGNEMASSATPVRDALYQLAGERLVEARTNEGFFLPHLYEAGLRDRYDWYESILKVAITAWPKQVRIAVPEQVDDYGVEIRSLFNAIAIASRNREHAVQIAAVADQLASIRLAEHRVVADAQSDVDAVRAAMIISNPQQVGKAVSAFHRARIRRVPEILAAIYGPWDTISV